MSRTKAKRKRFLVRTRVGEIVRSEPLPNSVDKAEHTFVPKPGKRGKKGMRRIVGSFDTRNEAQAFAGTSGRWAVIDTGKEVD